MMRDILVRCTRCRKKKQFVKMAMPEQWVCSHCGHLNIRYDLRKRPWAGK